MILRPLGVPWGVFQVETDNIPLGITMLGKLFFSTAPHSLVDRVAVFSVTTGLSILFYQTIPPASKYFWLVVGPWICGQKYFPGWVISTSLGASFSVHPFSYQMDVKYLKSLTIEGLFKGPFLGFLMEETSSMSVFPWVAQFKMKL